MITKGEKLILKNKLVSLTAAAVLLMSLYTGIASADTPYGTVDENGSLHVLAGTMTPTDLSVTLTGEEELYDSPSENSGIGISLSPQTVHAVAVDEAFFKINTWLGDKWIFPKHKIIYNIEPSQTELTLSSITPIYDFPNGQENTIAELSPQKVVAFERAAGGWYHIKTWLGDKWMNPDIALPKAIEKINTDFEVIGMGTVHKYPASNSKVLGIVPQDPIQTVTAFEKTENGWFHIHSSFGDGWILVDETSNATLRYDSIKLPQNTNKVINLKTETIIFSNPITDAWLAKLAPQPVHAIEVWNNNWYKIHTWLGDAWIVIPDQTT